MDATTHPSPSFWPPSGALPLGGVGNAGGVGGPEGRIAEQLADALASGDPKKLQQALTSLQALSDPAKNDTLGQLDLEALFALVELLKMAGALGQGAMPQGFGPSGGGGMRPAGGGGRHPMHVPPGFRPASTGAMPGGAMPGGAMRAGTGPVPSMEPNMRSAGKTPGKLLEKHQPHASTARATYSQPGQQADAAAFKRNFEANRSRYEAVAAKTNMPADLVAAIHWRESNGNFGTYMHQGDPLGKPAVNIPNDIPVFHRWEDSAVHALGQKSHYARALGLDQNSTDPAAKAAYAELYNGLGYHYKGKPSPYVYAGTDKYVSGKYVRDGVYDAGTVDRQNGVLALMQTLR